MAGWRKWFYSVGHVELASLIHRFSCLKSTTSTSMIGPHIFSNTNKYTHLSLRPVNPTNNYRNNNGKLKRYYGIEKVKCQRNHGTMKFILAHMNSVLVERWHYFKQQSSSAIIDVLNKNKLLPPCLSWSQHQRRSMSSSNPNTIWDKIRRNQIDF